MSSSGISAIVLAAGRSSRMGEPKAMLRLPGGDTFLGRIVTELLAGGAAGVVVVLSAADAAARAWVAPPLSGLVRCQVNPDPDRGQLSSLQCALSALDDEPAVLVTLVDVPLVSAAVVRALIGAWNASGAPLVRPTRAGRHGHPMLIAPPLIAELREADPSSSTRDIVRRYASRAVDVEIQEDGPFRDVDTPEEYERLIASLTADR